MNNMIATSLHKTNTRLASNIKVVIDSKSDMFLEMIPSSEYLALSMFKGYEYNKQFSWGTNIRNFVKSISNIDEIYSVADESLLDINDNLSTQYQQLYNWGCYSDPSKFIDENLRFFAPLHISNESETPDMFVILKIDDRKYNSLMLGNNELATWINYGEIVHTQDITELKKLIFDELEESYVNVQFNGQDEFNDSLQTYGLSVDTGMFKFNDDSTILDFLHNEVSITEFENWITNSYKRHNLIYNNIVNIEFAFTDKPTNKFERYVGLYVKRNKASLEEAKAYINSGSLNILQHKNRIEKITKSSKIEIFDEIGFSQFANSFGHPKHAILEFSFNVNPPQGSMIQLVLNGIAEHTIIITPAILGDTLKQTKLNIINSINTQYQGSSSTVNAQLLDSGWIRLQSNSINAQFENLKLIAPSFFNIKQPKFTTEEYKNTFVAGTSYTISLNTYVNPVVYNKLAYYNDDGEQIISAIKRVYEYKGDFLYELEDQIQNTANKPTHIWFVKTTESEASICSLFPHAEIDFDQEVSKYNDILDFDIDKYKKYLIDTVNEPWFTGAVLKYYDKTNMSEIDNIMLSEYKQVVLSKINAFIDAIVLNREYLFKNIDLSTSEATTTTNEYNRLEEIKNSILSSKNRLFQYINKWSHNRGKDVYMNPYRLNIALPFRNDSFAPSQTIIDRAISYHTHSWFVLADGQNPYFELNENTVNKHLSYTKLPLTSDLVLNTDVDAYDQLQYETSSSVHSAWTNFFYDDTQEACYAFFRGVLYRFETSELKDYRFSVMLKGSETIHDDVYAMKLLKNDKFKTLTLWINFYIPDPILTSLEQGNHQYYLDRALLYFSNEIYSTSQSAIDFGTDKISLKLYDNESPKTYLDQIVTNDWMYDAPNLGTILHVSVGNSSTFNVLLNDLLSVGDDFEIYYSLTGDTSSPFYGMYINFKEIVEVGATHFWCKEISITSNLTEDPDNIHDLDIADNIVTDIVHYNVYEEYANNPNIFNENNTIYISKAIANENCSYTKIVSASVNNVRYKEISLANIKNFMVSNAIRVNNTGSNFLKCSVLEPSEAQAIIRLFSSNNEIKQLVNAYAFPLKRYNGTYTPILNILSYPKSTSKFKRIYPALFSESFEYKLNISKNVSSKNLKIERFKSFTPYTNDKKFYSYLSAITGDEIVTRELPWCTNAKEHRAYASIVFNSTETFDIDYLITSNQINLNQLLKQNAMTWISIALIESMSSEDKLNLQRLYQDTVSLTSSNSDYRDILVRNFIQNTFMSIYHIEKIVDSNGNVVQFNIDNNNIIELLEVFESKKLKIHFKR